MTMPDPINPPTGTLDMLGNFAGNAQSMTFTGPTRREHDSLGDVDVPA